MKVICIAIEYRSSNCKKNGVKHVIKYLVVAENNLVFNMLFSIGFAV
jgi:hypothetical protein